MSWFTPKQKEEASVPRVEEKTAEHDLTCNRGQRLRTWERFVGQQTPALNGQGRLALI